MSRNHKPTLIVITGPTGSGKSQLAVDLAEKLGCEIISADSRQIFLDIPIGTAAPTAKQLAAVPHHFVGTLSLEQSYSAARFEADVLDLLPKLWNKNDYAIMCGGSMMYIDAVTKGIDDLPDISPEVRDAAMRIYTEGGINKARDVLKTLDPEYYKIVDINNHKRIVHAIEITMQAGVPYSSLRTGKVAERHFNIVKFAIDYPREELFDRINRRVEEMIASGFEREAEKVFDLRHLNSLNTVGFKELFAVLEGKMDRNTAIARIAKNTRVFAKKQLTWMKKDSDIHYLSPDSAINQILSILNK
ncbi:MAG: tRNA (adenosine(37)-N6)-dimethylallyltransferase MiaA [Paramuribaculum sp.]|nr:tRNA (adenosine(37)-N6)-dimethylallyltransferase MiaA [Paramuribaculum sp.]